MTQSDIPHFVHVAQRAPLSLLRQFLEKDCNDLVHSIDWTVTEKAVRSGMKQAAHDLPDDVRRLLDRVSERIDRMTDEAGVEAIGYIRDEIFDTEDFDRQEDQYGRSLWLYLNDRENFQRAEDTRYADEYRGSTRLYSAFRGPVGVEITITEEVRQALMAALAELFHTLSPVLFDHFVRPRYDIEEDEEIDLHQFSVHHNDEQQSVETIAEDGDRSLVFFCPLNSIKITYEPANGVVEVYSRNRSLHPEIFRRFALHILDREVDAARIPKRCYDLSSLAQPRSFPVKDPEIAAVKVSQIRLKVGARRSTLGLKLGDGETRTIWELADELVGQGNLLYRAYEINQACIVIKFHKLPHQRRPKSLPILISLPNGCNIKSHCDKDRQLAEKYLVRWQLVRPEESPSDDDPACDQKSAEAL